MVSTAVAASLCIVDPVLDRNSGEYMDEISLTSVRDLAVHQRRVVALRQVDDELVGTQEFPLDPTYRDTWGISVIATPDEPRNKTPPRRKSSDPHASEHFQSISTAYQTLSVPALRSKYHEFGTRESAPESVSVNPEEFGEAALQEAEEEAEREERRQRMGKGKGRSYRMESWWFARRTKQRRRRGTGSTEKAAARTERVTQLFAILERKLGIFIERATGIDDPIPARDLPQEFFGSELLQAIAFDYLSKANPFLATN
ncbi:hypothetical protein EV368DRAFT_81390 [Lentinula lateritia]|nr:hypothetical protein EV368DRAFT_81390 [Lentinula lateritia]